MSTPDGLKLPLNDTDKITDCASLVQTAKEAITQGDPLKALANFELATEIDPSNLDALIGKTRTLLRIGDVDQAVQTCDQLRQAHETPLVWALHEVVTTLYNAHAQIRHVNIGGGPFFNFSSWLNLESVPSPSNPIPTQLTNETTIPLETGAVRTVFSSHCFEHLDDETVARCLCEANRVLGPDGVLVIKLPNFDAALNAWQNNDLSYFSDKAWGYGGVNSTWASKGVVDSIDRRASMVFCGYGNQAYGDHFADRRNFGPDAYHGPADCDEGMLVKLKDSSSPWAIARALRTFVEETEVEPIFSHRNAWSEVEFKKLLSESGFRLLSTDAQSICTHLSHIPGIETAQDISCYYLCIVDGDTS